MTLFLQLTGNGLVNGVLYAMLAIGFGIIWRSLRIFHMAYAGLYLISGYAFFVLAGWLHLSVFTSTALVLFIAGLNGWLVEVFIYRPFYRKNASFGSILIASLGLFIVLVNLLAMVFGNELQTVQRALVTSYRLGPIIFTKLQLIDLFVGTATIGLFLLATRKVRIFKAIWAMGDQPDLIPVLGMPLFRLRSLVIILSTTMAAIPACLLTLEFGIAPYAGMSTVLIAAVAVLIGGFNSYAGWVWGAIILALLQSAVVWKFSARWMDLVTFSILLLILLFRPHGILTEQKRIEEAA